MTKIKNTNDSLSWRGCGERGTLLHCWWECQLVQLLLKSVWRFLRKMGSSLPQDAAIPLLGICPKEAHSYNKDICSMMFIAALCVIAISWKQSRCPSTEEWIEKMWYICTIVYYLVKKKKQWNLEIRRQMELEETILSEVTQSQKDKHGMYSLIYEF